MAGILDMAITADGSPDIRGAVLRRLRFFVFTPSNGYTGATNLTPLSNGQTLSQNAEVIQALVLEKPTAGAGSAIVADATATLGLTINSDGTAKFTYVPSGNWDAARQLMLIVWNIK